MNAIVINEVDRIRLLQSGELTASRYLVPAEIKRSAYVEQIVDTSERIPGDRILRWCNVAGGEFEEAKARYRIGEILCVREPWAKVKITRRWHAATFVQETTFFGYQYRADDVVYCPEAELCDDDPEKPYEIIVERIGGWQGAQTMPAKIARQFVVVTDIRFQRLSEMVEEDAIAEGWPDCNDPDGDSPLLRYSEAWDKRLNREDFKKFSWFHDPWTCAIRFRLTTPFDEINKGEFERSYHNMMEKLSELSHRVGLRVSHEAILADIDRVRHAAIVLRETYNNRKEISVDVGFAKLTAEPCCSEGGDPNGIVIGYTDENGVWTQDLAMVSVEAKNNDVATVRVWSDESSEDYTDYFAVSRYTEEE